MTGGEIVVLEKEARVFKRKDGKWLLYIPKDIGDDSQFPFKEKSNRVLISIDPVSKVLVVTTASPESK